MIRNLVLGAVFVASGVAAADEPRASPSGNASIRGQAGSSAIVITTTDRLAGAIHSLTWGGKEFIERQWNVRMPKVGTFYNPNEPRGLEPRRYAPLEPVLAYIRKTPFISGKATVAKK